MQENENHSEEIQLFDSIYFTTDLNDVLHHVAKWAQIIGVISLLNFGIAVVKLLSNINSDDLATKAISGVVGYLLLKAGLKIDSGLEKYNQTTLQEGFRYLYRYFFSSFILFVLIVIVMLVAFFVYFV